MSLFEENAWVLRDIAANGRDLSVSRIVDFAHLFSDRASAQAFVAEVARLGFKAEVDKLDDRDEESWDVTASTEMVPSCEGITRIEEQLDSIARKLGGHADGWGFYNP